MRWYMLGRIRVRTLRNSGWVLNTIMIVVSREFLFHEHMFKRQDYDVKH